MVSIADPVKPRRKPKPRTYDCAICTKPVRPDDAVFSRFTRQRFHPLCLWKGEK